MKKKKYDLLHEDEDYIIINKSAPLLSLPDRWDPEIPNALHYMKVKADDIYMVHRLDKETSGVMVFAKNEKSHAHACRLFENRDVHKEYLGIIEGNLSAKSGEIDQPIMSLPSSKGKMHINPEGKPSLTEYDVQVSFKGYSVVKFVPKSGRTHQIRVHTAFLGAPILADKVYGYSNEFRLSTIKRRKFKLKKNEVERPLMARHALHAHKISFDGINGKLISAEHEPPKDMRATINQMGKWIAE